MTDQIDQTLNLHALLIGIDCYLPNELPDGSYYRNLSGCVRDISHVEEFLKEKLGVPAERILKLTATDAGAEEPPEPRDRWPTYENMVRAFQGLAERTEPGDQIYIHYSGHGGRAPTMVPEIKGVTGLDESLVPTDIGDSEARYLRDIEMVRLLRLMVDKGLVVTMVLDSCHSKGMTRGPDTNIRGLGSIDTTPRPTESLVDTREGLIGHWRESVGTTRNATSNGWLPELKDFVLLAACGPSEYAFEYAFDGVESNGALTYWWLNSLGELGLGLTYKQLHERLVAKVHSQFERQTPHLEGDGSRLVLGVHRVPPTYSAVVMQVEAGTSRLLLNAGQMHRVRKGSQFSIHSLTATNLNNDGLALATVEKLGATESWGKFTAFNGAKVEQGAQAVLINPGSVQLMRKVRLLDDLDQPAANKERQAILEAVDAAIRTSPWLELATGRQVAQYQVAINAQYQFEILDRSGAQLTPNAAPISIGSTAAATALVNRLEHLTKYQAVQELDNHDTRSPLSRKLLVEWAGYQTEYEPGEKPDPTAFANGIAQVNDGDWVFLRVKNLSEGVLNVTALDLQPDWGISQVHPLLPTWFEALDPQSEELIPLQVALPENYQCGRDILKVFATIGSANFHWLQLPALDGGSRPAGTRGAEMTSLDQLLDAISTEQPVTRNLNPAAYPSRAWTTAQIELLVVKRV